MSRGVVLFGDVRDSSLVGPARSATGLDVLLLPDAAASGSRCGVPAIAGSDSLLRSLRAASTACTWSILECRGDVLWLPGSGMSPPPSSMAARRSSVSRSASACVCRSAIASTAEFMADRAQRTEASLPAALPAKTVCCTWSADQWYVRRGRTVEGERRDFPSAIVATPACIRAVIDWVLCVSEGCCTILMTFRW